MASRRQPHSAVKAVRARKPRGLGFTAHQRPNRVAITIEQHATRVRVDNPKWTDQEVLREAKRRVADELARVHPRARKQYLKVAPSSGAPNRRDVQELVEEQAIRNTPYGRALNRLLRTARAGRQTDRSLPVAVFERTIWSKNPPELKARFLEFAVKDDILHWAYDHPVTGSCGASLASVNATLKSALDFHDPDALIAFNIAALKELKANHPDTGRWLAVDGTNIIARCEQRASYSDYEEELLSRELGATFVFHNKGAGGKYWRGWTLTVLTDLKTTLPVVWLLRPAHRPEAESLRELLDLLFHHWPELCPETLSTDKAYDNEATAVMLERDYGIHPVSPLRQNFGHPGPEWVATEGTPKCPAHGLMMLEQSDAWLESKDRDAAGLAPGEPSPDWEKARHRWKCSEPTCPLRTTTKFRDNPRLYSYLPRQGDHLRVGLRVALQYRHNAAESVNSSLKGRGLGQRGSQTPQWVGSDRQMQWYAGGNCLAMTLRRLVHEDGTYAAAKADASARGLLAPSGGRPATTPHIAVGQQGLNRGAGKGSRRLAGSARQLVAGLQPRPGFGQLKVSTSAQAVAAAGNAGARAARAAAAASQDSEEVRPSSPGAPAALDATGASAPAAWPSPSSPSPSPSTGARFSAGLRALHPSLAPRTP